MHGIGNDYVYIDCIASCPLNLPSLAREMSDRHRGIGGDGIILILPSSEADFKMRIFNADGSEARMCGNGSRCVAKYVYDNHLTDKRHLTLETLSGVKHLFLKPGPDGCISEVTVDMGEPSLSCSDIPVNSVDKDWINKPVKLDDTHTLYITAVSMGNPHAVIFCDDPYDIPFEQLGAAIEFHHLFPDRVNVEFVHIIDRNNIRVRVWERGSGETLACGTGACATVVAAATLGLTGRDVNVQLAGGRLNIDWRADDNHVFMTGPATTVFTGEYFLQNNEGMQ